MRDVFPSECGSRRGRWRGVPAVVAVPRARSSARTRDFRRGEKQIAFAEVHFPALRHAPDEARSWSFATAFRRVRAARMVHNPPRFPDSTQSRVPAGTRRRRDALLLTAVSHASPSSQVVRSTFFQLQSNNNAQGAHRPETRPPEEPIVFVPDTRMRRTHASGRRAVVKQRHAAAAPKE